MSIPLIGRDINDDELFELALLFGAFTDGSGQIKIEDNKSLPGWLDFERICAEFFHGYTLESKDPFDVIIPYNKSNIGVSIKSKSSASLKNLLSTENKQIYIELSNSSAKFWNQLKLSNFSESNFGDNKLASEFGEIISSTSNTISTLSTIPNIDINKSVHLVITYLKPQKGYPPLYQIHTFHLFLPKHLKWHFSSTKCLRGTLSNKTIVDWYGLSGGQLKYYPPASEAVHATKVFTIPNLKPRSISSKVRPLRNQFKNTWDKFTTPSLL